jgi:hypothetical protein
MRVILARNSRPDRTVLKMILLTVRELAQACCGRQWFNITKHPTAPWPDEYETTFAARSRQHQRGFTAARRNRIIEKPVNKGDTWQLLSGSSNVGAHGDGRKSCQLSQSGPDVRPAA